MSFKNEVVSIGTTDTDIHEMGAGLEGAVVLGVGNTTAGAISTTIKFYKQSLGTTTTLVSSKSIAANDLVKIAVPIAMEAGDKIIMSAASAGLRAFATVTDSSSIGSGGAWNPRGEYSAVATYAKRDVVYVPDDGVSYISLQDSNTGNTPSTQPSFWMVNAAKGDTGADGELVAATDADIRSANGSTSGVTPANIESASAGVPLTDAATVAVDWDSGINFTLTVTASRAIGNPTNGQPGTYRTILVQGNDATDRTITFGNQFLGDVPTITDCDSGKWYLLTLYCISTSHFLASSKVAKQ